MQSCTYMHWGCCIWLNTLPREKQNSEIRAAVSQIILSGEKTLTELIKLTTDLCSQGNRTLLVDTRRRVLWGKGVNSHL